MIDIRKNNFDFIRILAASMVVFAHSFDLLYPAEKNAVLYEPLRIWTKGEMSFGTLGVAIFFCISGYLITQSLTRSSSYTSYFAKRSLRIFPALVLDILIAVFIWGVLCTTLPLTEYFSRPEPYLYLLNFSLFHLSYNLPGVFENNVVPNVVNSSLWTLPYEFTCYFGVVLLHRSFILRHKYAFALFYAIFIFAGFFVLRSNVAVDVFFGNTISLDNIFILGAYFGAGALFFLFKDKIPLHFGISSLLLGIWLIGLKTPFSLYFSFFCLPYIIFWFVFEPKIPLTNAGKFGDFSYGLYIYSYPVQQTISYLTGGQISIPLMIILSFLFTVPLAMFSWFVIEKRALNLKDLIFSREKPSPTLITELGYATGPTGIN
jgi:peptidoglycan/LPS O-acetylase OafA/YrhL